MNIPLHIDLNPLMEQYNLTQENCNDIIDSTVKEITAQFAREWEQTALRELGSTKNRYVQNLSVIDEGRMMGAVVLDYTKDPLIQMLEEGASGFDMKEGFLNSPKAKTGKNGNKYLTIPFSWGGSDSIESNSTFSNKMPKEIEKIVKSKDIGKAVNKSDLNKLGGSFAIPKTRDKVEIPKSKTFESYTHKSSIYEGITKTKDSVTGQTSTNSFRRVSLNSSPNSWIHPGIEAKNIAELSLDNFENKIEPIMTRAIDNALSALGFE